MRDADRRKDEFLATLAHELRNPLAPIRTGLEVLNSTSDAKESERVRTMMGRQLAHLIRLVDDLLDVSRITSGKVVLKKQRIDLREVIEDTKDAIGDKGPTLTTYISIPGRYIVMMPGQERARRERLLVAFFTCSKPTSLLKAFWF